MIRLKTMRDLHALKRAVKSGKNVLVEAYRITGGDGESYYFPRIKPILTTKVGRVLVVKRPNCDANTSCGAGINVATYRWCKERTIYTFYRTMWAVRFHTKDIAVIPKFTDGKFRLRRCKVVRKVRIKRRQWGWP